MMVNMIANISKILAWVPMKYPTLSRGTFGSILKDIVESVVGPLIINVCEIAAFGALVGIVYAGFLYASAMGDAGKAARGKKALKNSIIGAIITKAAATIGSYMALIANKGHDSAEGAAREISIQLAIWAGAFAVASIVYGAFMYASSAGDAGKASRGKNTIILACTGLIIIAAAEAILLYFLEKFGVS